LRHEIAGQQAEYAVVSAGLSDRTDGHQMMRRTIDIPESPKRGFSVRHRAIPTIGRRIRDADTNRPGQSR
jgi:protein-tyrosine-phosphatase